LFHIEDGGYCQALITRIFFVDLLRAGNLAIVKGNVQLNCYEPHFLFRCKISDYSITTCWYRS